MRLCLVFAAAVLVLLPPGCSQQLAEPRGCAADAECGAGAFCREGTCAASQAPVARVTAPAGPLLSHSRLPFDGRGSSDPDPGDGVAAYAWSARAAGAACEPARATGTGPGFELLVSCSGAFEVSLEVSDSHGLRSAPAVLPVEVSLHPSPPSATVAGPTALQHRCSGTPLLCTAVDGAGGNTFALVAAAASPAGDAFTWRWSARPPAALSASARVAFSPADSPTPSVAIETDGTAIAGDYLLAVEATDALGFVASAEVTVTVGNRPPEARTAGTTLFLPHSYDPSRALFLAHGQLAAFEVVDPDGDPVATSYAAQEAGLASPSMAVTADGTAAAIDVAVPAGEPASLIGPEVRRTLLFRADDGNGGTAEVSWPVEVLNRPPRMGSAVLYGAAGHTFDPVARRYLAEVQVTTYVDDDGDPLTLAATGTGACGEFSLSGGALRVHCSLAYLGALPAQPIGGAYLVEATLSDPWSAVGPRTGHAVVTNRPPVAGALSLPAATCCSRSCTEWEWDPEARVNRCLNWVTSCTGNAGSGLVPSDPDGDPLLLSYGASGSYSVAPSSHLCLPGSCSPATITASGACGTEAGSVFATVSDGMATASASAP